MFLINKNTALLVTGVRMLHSHSVDEGAFDRMGHGVTFKIDVHDEEAHSSDTRTLRGTTADQSIRADPNPSGTSERPDTVAEGRQHQRGIGLVRSCLSH